MQSNINKDEITSVEVSRLLTSMNVNCEVEPSGEWAYIPECEEWVWLDEQYSVNNPNDMYLNLATNHTAAYHQKDLYRLIPEGYREGFKVITNKDKSVSLSNIITGEVLIKGINMADAYGWFIIKSIMKGDIWGVKQSD